jgi:hypothetical protein
MLSLALIFGDPYARDGRFLQIAPQRRSLRSFVIFFTTVFTIQRLETGGENGPVIRLGTLIPITPDPSFLKLEFPTDTPLTISLPPI